MNITVKNHSSAPIWGSLFAILPIGFRPSEYTSAIAIYNINGNFSVSHISLNENGELKASIPYGNGIGSCSFSFIAKK